MSVSRENKKKYFKMSSADFSSRNLPVYIDSVICVGKNGYLFSY